jgi:hypothetical protein
MITLTRRGVLVGAACTAAVAVLPLPALEAETAEATAAPATPATAGVASAGRWAVDTYASAWRRLCEAVWCDELQDPMFSRAVELAGVDMPGLRDSGHWLGREGCRNEVRVLWHEARIEYRPHDAVYWHPDSIPADWVDRQRKQQEESRWRGWGCEQEHWQRVRTLAASGDFWPLHLDSEHLLRAQLDTLRLAAATGLRQGECATWWRA